MIDFFAAVCAAEASRALAWSQGGRQHLAEQVNLQGSTRSNLRLWCTMQCFRRKVQGNALRSSTGGTAWQGTRRASWCGAVRTVTHVLTSHLQRGLSPRKYLQGIRRRMGLRLEQLRRLCERNETLAGACRARCCQLGVEGQSLQPGPCALALFATRLPVAGQTSQKKPHHGHHRCLRPAGSACR